MKTFSGNILRAGGLAVALTLASSAFAVEVDPKRPISLVAVIHPTEGNVAKGTVTFTDLGEGLIEVNAKVEGLMPGSEHGFHIHEYGDASDPKGESAGWHFNPEGHDHALPTNPTRHAGDLGNLVANEQGHASYTGTVKNLTLFTGSHAILGRSVVVHAKADDGGQPTGNAGPRIGVGVIGYQDPSFAEKVKHLGHRIAGKVGEAIEKAGEGVEKAADKVEEKIDEVVR